MTYESPALSEYDVKAKIREEYKSVYDGKAAKQRPWLSRAANALTYGGVGAAGLGVLGIFASVGLGFFGVAAIGAVYFAAVGTTVTGVAGFFRGMTLGARLDRVSAGLLEADIDNYTLVKKYLQDILPSQNRNLAKEREAKKKAFDLEMAELDKRQEVLDRHKLLGLDLLSRGFAALERNIDKSRDEITRFKQEASETLGVDFGVAAQKNVQVPAVLPQPAVVEAPPQPSWPVRRTGGKGKI